MVGGRDVESPRSITCQRRALEGRPGVLPRLFGVPRGARARHRGLQAVLRRERPERRGVPVTARYAKRRARRRGWVAVGPGVGPRLFHQRGYRKHSHGSEGGPRPISSRQKSPDCTTQCGAPLVGPRCLRKGWCIFRRRDASNPGS